jgi:hypothetical protein
VQSQASGLASEGSRGAVDTEAFNCRKGLTLINQGSWISDSSHLRRARKCRHCLESNTGGSDGRRHWEYAGLTVGWCLRGTVSAITLLTVSAWKSQEAELQWQLVEPIWRLDSELYRKAEEFIEGWKRLISDPRYEGCPHSCLWRTSIANYAEGAALLGLPVNPQEHRPYTPIRWFASCVICDREESGEEELRAV